MAASADAPADAPTGAMEQIAEDNGDLNWRQSVEPLIVDDGENGNKNNHDNDENSSIHSTRSSLTLKGRRSSRDNQRSSKALRTILLILALSIHSLLEGLAFGLTVGAVGACSLYWGVCYVQTVMGIAQRNKSCSSTFTRFVHGLGRRSGNLDAFCSFGGSQVDHRFFFGTQSAYFGDRG